MRPRPMMPSVCLGSSQPANCFLPSSTWGWSALVVAAQAVDEAQCRAQVARREQHACDHQLLHGVGVGAGRVENRHAALAHLLHGDVVGAGARATDRLDARGDGHVVHVVRAHQDGVRAFYLLAEHV